MGIYLFEHNEIAYDSAVTMMSEVGKAAIIHPTGTGKSFIGFKLAEQNSNKVICWLSPSEYIFKTQLENLKAASDDYEPKNIIFLTYAKLMLMGEEVISEIQPNYIILDEFHRCGATEWGKGVDKLLKTFPNSPILGLSATNIRYLDNQRDMADELFEGNIASEMTLGEAIVRNILLPPTYIISVYSFQKELERYQKRVSQMKSSGIRDSNQKYLDALRRSLEKADGLDVIFSRHIKEKNSKYIVFCANYEHMQEMVSHVYEWFSGIDIEPHIYSAYSDDPSTSKEFISFKQDTSEHLKLLFCIDMLNEGVHIDDVSGVILFRPTVSPIIYKQQIGRALSASKSKEPIIFDIVNNFDNLYSIGTIQEEMQLAVTYYRSFDNDYNIISDKFNIIDETRDCRQLFDELQNSLSASWDLLYLVAKIYYEKHGNLDVPKRYTTEDKISLGSWLMTQRRVRSGKIPGILTEKQIKKLDDIGMIWDNRLELAWEQNYREAQAYYDIYGDLNVNVNYITPNGFALGTWIANLRQKRIGNIQALLLNDERIARLDRIGMIWDKFSYIWEQNFLAAMRYYLDNGHLNVPNNYKTKYNISLGTWINNLRRKGKNEGKGSTLTQSQIERLEAIGMIWDNIHDARWNSCYEEAKAYYAKYGNIDVPYDYKTKKGTNLGKWIYNQRKLREKYDNLSASIISVRIAKLDSIGMIWTIDDAWEKRYQLAKQYFDENSNLNIAPNYVTESNIWLGKWLYIQKQVYNGKISHEQLTLEQIAKLEGIGIIWKASSELKWENGYKEALEYYLINNNLDITKKYRANSGYMPGLWISRQRKKRCNNELTDEQIERLDTIGMIWELDDSWEEKYILAVEYYQENGNLNIQSNYITKNGVLLGKWLIYQRCAYNGVNQYGRLTESQIEKLNRIEMDWLPATERKWQNGFYFAKNYFEINGNLNVASKYIDEDGFPLGEWLQTQRKSKKKNALSDEKTSALNSIAMNWNGTRS